MLNIEIMVSVFIAVLLANLVSWFLANILEISATKMIPTLIHEMWRDLSKKMDHVATNERRV